MVSGLGAATADAIYGSIAGFGLTVASGFLASQQLWLRIVGGVFLCYLGVRTLLAKPPQEAVPSVGGGLLVGAYVSTLFLTLTNPVTIISFAAVFAGWGLVGNGGGYLAAGILVSGVFIGSLLWWFLLVAGVGILRERFSASGLKWVNRVSGGIIAGFGLLALLSVV